ncbi:MAG: hypothetical protein AB8B97_03925 [Granulosicoccus sp.]
MRTCTQTALESARHFKNQFTQFINNPAGAATIAQCGTVSGSLGVIGTLGGEIVVGGVVSGGVCVMASNSSISSLSDWGFVVAAQ